MISSAIVAVLGFLSAAVFTRLLSPGDYGVYTIGLSIANFVSAMAFTWVRYSVMRFESEGDKADVRMTSLAAYVVSAATAPVILIFVQFVAHIGWDRTALAVALSLGLSLFELGQEILRSRLRVLAFMIGTVLRSAFAFGVCILIAEFGGGGLGQLAGAAVAYYLAAAINGREIWRGPRAPIDLGKLKLFFWLGLSVTAAGFLFTFQVSLDRLFIAWRFGDSEAGLYGASADVVRQIILIPAGSVAAAAFPLTVRVFATGTAEETRRQLERTAELLLTVLAPAAVGLALTAPYLISFLLGPAFRSTATTVMPILAFAWLFQSISQTYINVSFHLALKQSLSIPHALAALSINALCLWPLTSHFGLAGAAWSLMISEAVGALAGLLLTRRAHPLPLILAPIGRLAIACGWMAVGVLGLERLMPNYSAGAFIALAAAGAFIYVAVALMLNICNSRTGILQLIEGAAANWFGRRAA